MSLSVKFNGVELSEYIDVLQGFTPFSGANWAPEVIGDDGITRGSAFKYTTYKSKTIPMPFTVSGNINGKYDELQKILNVNEPKELVFGNTPDRFCYAIPVGDFDFADWECLGEGTITWLVPDGLSHSSVEKTFSAAANSNGILEATIVNNGTEAVPIDYTIKHNHENGYIGIVSEHGVIQLGKANEADGETYLKSVTLTDSTESSKWSADAKWVDDKGINGQNVNNKTQGSFDVKTVSGDSVLVLATKGTAEAGKWNGAMKTFTVRGVDGEVGAKDFYGYVNSWFEGAAGQTGCQTFTFLDETNKCICYQSIWKSDTNGNTAHMAWGIGGDSPRKINEVTFTTANDMTHNPFTTRGGHSDIKKEGSKITFYWWGKYFSVNVPELANTKVAKVQLYIGQIGARNLSTQYLTRNYVRKVRLQILKVSAWRDVPNRYQTNDMVYINGAAARVYVNGMVRMEDEILGSTYFKAPPGETKVQFRHSEFSDPVPTITAKIREAYL